MPVTQKACHSLTKSVAMITVFFFAGDERESALVLEKARVKIKHCVRSTSKSAHELRTLNSFTLACFALFEAAISSNRRILSTKS